MITQHGTVKRFGLTINLENDAFQDSCELSRILTDIANELINEPVDGATSSNILDINGNKVGTWHIR